MAEAIEAIPDMLDDIRVMRKALEAIVEIRERADDQWLCSMTLSWLDETTRQARNALKQTKVNT